MSRTRVLIVNGGFPLPANSGVNIRTWNFVRALRDSCDVSLVYPLRSGRTVRPELQRDAEESLLRIWSVPVPVRSAVSRDPLRRRLARKLQMVPWEIHASFEPAFAEGLRSILTSHEFDVILARHIYQAQYLFDVGHELRARVVVDVDDVETRRAARFLAVSSGKRIDRWRRAFNNWALAEYHRRHLRTVGRCLVCSEDDRRYVLERHWSDNVAVVPNAVDVPPAGDGHFPDPTEPHTMLLCGTLSYGPNADAAKWFVHHVLPLIRSAVRDARLLVVGHAPSDEVRALAKGPGVEVHADVLDLAVFYARAAVSVVPLRVGGGTRLKILESGVHRRPVVSTTIGAEGLELLPDEHYLRADDPVTFAAGCRELLEDRDRARDLGHALRNAVTCVYDTSVVFPKIRMALGVA